MVSCGLAQETRERTLGSPGGVAICPKLYLPLGVFYLLAVSLPGDWPSSPPGFLYGFGLLFGLFGMFGLFRLFGFHGCRGEEREQGEEASIEREERRRKAEER